MYLAELLYNPDSLFAKIFTVIGEIPALFPIIFLAVLAVVLALKKQPFTANKKVFLRYGVFALVAVALTAATVAVTKNFVGRERYYTSLGANYTPWYVIGNGGDSFPSGHASMSFFVFLIPDFIKRVLGKKCVTAYIVSAAFVVCVGLARMMEGAHYFSDVCFGVLIAFVYACACAKLFDITREA